MTSEQKQAWIYAEEHRVGRTIRVVESARKAAVADWDRKLRLLNGYKDDLERAADDQEQLELFEVANATPDAVARVMENPDAG
jgi:hypothetical protein